MITQEQIDLLNDINKVTYEVKLGDLIRNAESQNSDQKFSEDFLGDVMAQAKAGGAATGATGDTNQFLTANGNIFEYHIKGTQTILIPVSDAAGLDVGMDQTADDGVEVTQGITAGSKMAFTCGSDRFFLQSRVKIADVSGSDDLAFGFRKAEAYQAAIDSYDEMAALNVISGNVFIETILNNAATVSTDTGANVADGNYVDLRIEVDHIEGLKTAIALANDLKEQYSQHISSTSAHAAADTTHVISAQNATNLQTLLKLVTELLTDYDAHEGDAELGAAWVYHIAQEAGDHSLASTVAPTTLPQAIARLNDFRTKFTAHDADATAHTTGGLFPATVVAAGSTFFKVGVNGADLAEPATIAKFTFDDGEVVVPFFYFLNDTDLAGAVNLQNWEVGLLS